MPKDFEQVKQDSYRQGYNDCRQAVHSLLSDMVEEEESTFVQATLRHVMRRLPTYIGGKVPKQASEADLE